MNKGYILILSLITFLIVTTLFSTTYLRVHQLKRLSDDGETIYRRLESERLLFDEILFRKSLDIQDDFVFFTNYYDYNIKIYDDDLKVYVNGLENYTMWLKYDDNCICFIEILYK